jgi:pimeloyl-ACP methyl ester carboxylesterase
MSQVRSKDGTTIAYERSGNGPALILVDGALCSRAFGPSQKIAPLLARQFTVYAYDRRGRGGSGDTPPYSPAREVEDLAALIEVAGGSAVLLGLSSGGALSLEAAASGLAVTKVARTNRHTWTTAVSAVERRTRCDSSICSLRATAEAR